MNPVKVSVLTINGGSSSIKFALYGVEERLTQLWYGEIQGIGMKDAKFFFNNVVSNHTERADIKVANHKDAANFLMRWFEKQDNFVSVKAIGHRIVHGMKHTGPEKISDELLDELKKISAYDPDHLPDEIKLIEVFKKRYPSLLQIACFDTSFHTTMPPVAKLLSIPRRYQAMGIQRYGFHGLSYAYLVEELEREATTQGKVILAHLGSGASIAAVKDGKSMDTSMGFTPTSGLPMSTRTGDLDPGVAWYLMQNDKLSPEQFSHLINHKSGLLGISGTSGDMQELLKNEGTDTHAAEAIELFCYQTRKWIGSFAAVLEGLDTLVFSGGIGENAAVIRERICRGLGFLGIEIDEVRNLGHEKIISTDTSKISVRVIPTNEELMIAKLVDNIIRHTVKI